MHSKWQIWDFFSSYDKSFLPQFEGILGISTFDPTCLKMVKDFLFKNLDRTIHHKMASEVTRNWIEEEFHTLSLFSNTDSFFIHQAQDLNVEILQHLLLHPLTERFVVLSFESENAVWKKFLKQEGVNSLTVESPRFWELNKLLDFVSSYLRLPLSFQAKNWILDSIENNLPDFYNSCCLIKLNYPDAKEVSKEQVQELLSLEKLDQFELASMFCRKKYEPFFEKIVLLEGDFERMRFLFNFLQSHLIKMTDTSYLAQKPRLTQYDKDIQNTSKLWKTHELILEIGRFEQWELMCKKKDSKLWHEVRRAHLESLSTLK